MRNLIILHGALGAQDQFDVLADSLESEFNIYLLNFSGHGGESFESNFSIEQFATELEAFITNNELHQPLVFGYSMGGYVALKLASEKPDLIHSLFTLGTKFDWSPATAAHEVKMLNPEKIEEKVPAFAKALEERHAPNDWKEVLSRTKQMMLDLGNTPALSISDFEKIEMPVMIGIGDSDNMVSLAESEAVSNALPNGQLRVFDGFKHPIEQVDLTILKNELVRFFG